MRLHLKPFLIWRKWFQHQVKLEMSTWIQPKGYQTDIVIYNITEKRKVPLILKNEKIATWYMCGPTVYDSSHIGHACSYMRLDIIRRILAGFFDINVFSVMGITDIDDKIIRRAQGSSQFSDWTQLAKFYEQEFYSEIKSLNILPPDVFCRVSDFIPEIIQFISRIIEKNLAYQAKDGSVYFNTQEYGKYGKFNEAEHETHPIKKSNLDFALWKASKVGEPFWESPWGPGRPGWHIECSTMASYTLGDNIDLHSGGLDLLFPHHENEEAQSCCHHGTDQWINYWIHTGLLHLADIKMSKSLQNTISIKELLEKYTANQFRMLCLLTSYRSPIEFSHEAMMKAITMLKKFEYFQSDCQNYITGKLSPKSIDEPLVYSKLSEAMKNIHPILANDFATSPVIEELSDLVGVVNKMLSPSQETPIHSGARSSTCIYAVSKFISRTLSTLGMSNSPESVSNNEKLTDVVDSFVKFRSVVRNRALSQSIKDKEILKACDDARKNLAVCGIKIKDYKDTATWTITDG